MRRRWTDDDLILAVNECENLKSVLDRLGLAIAGGSYTHIQKHMVRLGISFETTNRERQSTTKNKYTNEELFVENGLSSTEAVKIRYRLMRIESYFCDECGIVEWKNKKLSLHIDHINGNRYDNRLENLRFLCPNCHNLTETYSGRNIIRYCPNGEIGRRAKFKPL